MNTQYYYYSIDGKGECIKASFSCCYPGGPDEPVMNGHDENARSEIEAEADRQREVVSATRPHGGRSSVLLPGLGELPKVKIIRAGILITKFPFL